jgi:osmotically inducible protein OsmC
MAVRNAKATWEGSLREGHGSMKFGTYEGPYTWSSRFEEGQGTNPEELVGAAHAGCYSMALSSGLGSAGFTPKRISTSATVYLERVEGKSRITKIHLETRAEVPGIGAEAFLKIAEDTKLDCPVSAALSGVEITLDAQLI